MDDVDQQQLSLESEPEEIKALFAKLVVFLQGANRKWIDTTARKLSEEDIREYLCSYTEFGGQPDISRLLHAYVCTKALLEAGSSIIEFVDDLPRPGDEGRVLGPTRNLLEKINAARFAADVCGTSTLLMATTYARVAQHVSSDIDPRDREFISGERTRAGLFPYRASLKAAIVRSLAYAPYADLVCFECPTVDLSEAEQFARSIHAEIPQRFLAYNCSALHKENKLERKDIEEIQSKLGRMGYVLQFSSLGGFGTLVQTA
ncbi:MAG TPA: hypothetical protein VJS17_01070 [Pyrinomonadaceae bacterium]|nr:hypothetical protein [Pyrinomonadaceae bacterium]